MDEDESFLFGGGESAMGRSLPFADEPKIEDEPLQNSPPSYKDTEFDMPMAGITVTPQRGVKRKLETPDQERSTSPSPTLRTEASYVDATPMDATLSMAQLQYFGVEQEEDEFPAPPPTGHVWCLHVLSEHEYSATKPDYNECADLHGQYLFRNKPQELGVSMQPGEAILFLQHGRTVKEIKDTDVLVVLYDVEQDTTASIVLKCLITRLIFRGDDDRFRTLFREDGVHCVAKLSVTHQTGRAEVPADSPLYAELLKLVAPLGKKPMSKPARFSDDLKMDFLQQVGYKGSISGTIVERKHGQPRSQWSERSRRPPRPPTPPGSMDMEPPPPRVTTSTSTSTAAKTPSPAASTPHKHHKKSAKKPAWKPKKPKHEHKRSPETPEFEPATPTSTARSTPQSMSKTWARVKLEPIATPPPPPPVSRTPSPEPGWTPYSPQTVAIPQLNPSFEEQVVTEQMAASRVHYDVCKDHYKVRLITDITPLLGRFVHDGTFANVHVMEADPKLVVKVTKDARYDMVRAVKEICCLWTLRHCQYVIQLREIIERPSANLVISALVFDQIDYNLNDFCKTMKLNNKEGMQQAVVPILEQLCAALAECHQQGIAHLDLCFENVCVQQAEDGHHVYLIDFGAARFFLHDDLAKVFSDPSQIPGEDDPPGWIRAMDTGHTLYRPPELLTTGGKLVLLDPTKADVYGFAVLAWELLHQGFIKPYTYMSARERYENIRQKDRRPPTSDMRATDCTTWLELLKRAWHHDPHHRWSFSKIGDYMKQHRESLVAEVRQLATRLDRTSRRNR